MRPPLLALYVFCLIFVSRSLAQDDNKPPLAKVLPVTQEIGAFLVTAMSNCPPASKTTKVIAGINRNGTYTLVGDLFHNGETNALIDCHIPHGIDNYGDEVSVDNVIISKWSGKKWNSIGFIDIEPNWIKHSSERGADNDKPFWMLYLSGHPIIVVAGGVEKEGQNFSCFLIDHSGTKILDSCGSFSIQPNVKANYLLTGDSSRGKAEYDITYFSRIENKKFVVKKSWSNSDPYSQPHEDVFDYECYTCESDGNEYVMMEDYSKSAHPASWVVFKGPVEINGWEGIANAWKEYPPYAKVYFSLKGNYDPKIDPGNAEGEIAYMFERLTGLPRYLYRLDADNSYDGKIESRENIKVTGSPEAVKLLSP